MMMILTIRSPSRKSYPCEQALSTRKTLCHWQLNVNVGVSARTLLPLLDLDLENTLNMVNEARADGWSCSTGSVHLTRLLLCMNGRPGLAP